MKRSDLHREWERVLDMCEGTGASPGICWRINGHPGKNGCEPCLNDTTNLYEFAVAILEGKPVFVGDKVYRKPSGNEQIIFDNVGLDRVDWSLYTWNPPKKTFMLNGEELPSTSESGNHALYIFGKLSTPVHYFNTKEERDRVEDAINKLLKESTGNGE